jgi:YHS domain-containing protein
MGPLKRIARFLLWGVLLNCALWLLRRHLARAVAPKAPGTPVHPGRAPIALERDPLCGAYVSPEISLKVEQAGRTQHFCSAGCRDRYLQPARRAASA